MQRHSLVALATFAALLAGAFYVLTRPQEAGMQRLDLSFLQQVPIDRLEVSGARNAVLHREGDAWLLGNQHAVDAAVMQDALHKLQGLNTSDYLGDDASRFTDLGVAGEQAITVRALAGGETKLTLLLGRPAAGNEPGAFLPLGHVRHGDQVFAESTGLVAAFDRDVAAWEDRAFVREAEGDFASLQVRLHNQPSYGLRAGADGWELEAASEGAPRQGPQRFDPQQAALLVNRLTNSRIHTLVDQDPGLLTTGLGEDEADKLAWRLTDAAAARLGHGNAALWLGKDHADGGVWARSEGRELPFVLDAQTAESLRRPLDSFAALTMMAAVDVEQVTGVTFEAKSGRQVKFGKTGDTWKTVRAGGLPKDFELDPNKLKARLRQALLSRALGLAPALPGAKAKLLRQGGGKLVLTLADKTEQVLQFGQETKLGGTPVLYATGTADGQVYLASKPLRDNVLDKLETLGKAARRDAAAGSQAAAAAPGPQGLDSLPPEVQESIRRQLAGGAP